MFYLLIMQCFIHAIALCRGRAKRWKTADDDYYQTVWGISWRKNFAFVCKTIFTRSSLTVLRIWRTFRSQITRSSIQSDPSSTQPNSSLCFIFLRWWLIWFRFVVGPFLWLNNFCNISFLGEFANLITSQTKSTSEKERKELRSKASY